MQFHAYFDASGSSDDPAISVLTVAGYIAADEDWARFDTEWQAVLNRYGVTCLHMRNYTPSRREFEGWDKDEPKRKQFIADLASVVGRHTREHFSINLFLDDYRLADERYKLREFAPPYVLAAQFVAGDAQKWMSLHQPENSFLAIFEKGDTDQHRVRDLFTKWGLNLQKDPEFLSKQLTKDNRTGLSTLPLQACDLLAYEQNKLLTDYLRQRKTKARGSFFALLEASESVGKRYSSLAFPFFKIVCEALHVERREGDANS
jgi:hypothetical protein